MIRVLLVEDQAMMRGALAVLLALEDDLDVVGQVSSAREVLPAMEEHHPDVALLDIELPDGNGLDVCTHLRAAYPACAVVIVTTFGRPGYLRRAFRSGATGFLVKDGPVDALASAVRRVHAGESVVDPDLAAAALSSPDSPLSVREEDVLLGSIGGATTAYLAGRLHLSESTVRNYLSTAITKTGTRNRAEALAVAREHGWL